MDPGPGHPSAGLCGGRHAVLPEERRLSPAAAAGCFVIAAGALGRTAFTLCRDGAAALLSYTALFIPLFTMAGLLCLVMAGLFHRAAEMKAENDLTI
ncbi:MAG: DUF2975 domain-containing protein [Oscillibacter sp.]